MRSLLTLGCMTLCLAGCTTLSDFVQMTPQDRAQNVCANAGPIYTLAQKRDELDRLISTTSNNLARGFALYKQCHDVRIPDTTQSDCWTDKYGHRHCKSVERMKTVRQCTDIPIPINAALEQNKLNNYQFSRAQIEQERNALFSACFAKVLPMPPDLAYWYYDNSKLP